MPCSATSDLYLKSSPVKYSYLSNALDDNALSLKHKGLLDSNVISIVRKEYGLHKVFIINIC